MRRKLLIAGMLGLAAALTVIAVVLLLGSLDTAGQVAGLITAVAAFPALAWGLWVWSRQWTPADLESAREKLTDLVRRQWEDEEAHRGLGDPHPMPVRWQPSEREGISAHPDVVDTPSTGSSDQIALLVERFRASQRRRLVILGGAGAGKTTLAVQLVRRLVNPRQAGEPVPVLLTLTEWNPEEIGTQELRDWLEKQLIETYPALWKLDRRTLRELVKPRGILPVLDGLDELPATTRVRVFSALQRAMERDEQMLILTSRTDHYLQTVLRKGPLTAAAVIEPSPLIPVEAAGYLRHAWYPPGPQRQPILDALEAAEPPTALAEAVSTPLGLWLLRVAHNNRQTNTSVLLDTISRADADALRGHLFDQLIPGLIDARELTPDDRHPFQPRRRYAAEDVRRWMESLAFYVSWMPPGPHLLESPVPDGSGEPTRDFRWTRLARTVLPSHVLPKIYALISIPLGVILGAVAGIAANHWLNSPAYIFLFSLAGGAVTGYRGYQRGDQAYGGVLFRDTLLTADPRSLRHLLRLGLCLLGGGAAAAVGGITFYGLNQVPFPDAKIPGLPVWLTSHASADTLFWTFVLLTGYCLGWAFVFWAAGPLESDQHTPFASWRIDRDAGLIRLTGIAVCGVACGGVLGAAEERLDVAVLGAVFFGGLGLAWGLVPEDDSWLAHRITFRYLAARGDFPKKLMNFLDDAHRIGLLRAFGPVYQFRHAEFQDHLLRSQRDFSPPPYTLRDPEARTGRPAPRLGEGTGTGV
ncbi:NACHT domain-containing protein [Streptomyces sp. NPDC005408]|uniref:NACHT domain-containing protein n=1 Tax=Streptomyces sp. NPDC005408 TaxID=3155341 RepID=UPI0033A04684